MPMPMPISIRMPLFCGCKYTKDFKEEKCKKHNACFSCLRTTEHKSDSCPNRRRCLICSRFHHFNLHTKDEINKYYDNKKKKTSQKSA